LHRQPRGFNSGAISLHPTVNSLTLALSQRERAQLSANLRQWWSYHQPSVTPLLPSPTLCHKQVPLFAINKGKRAGDEGEQAITAEAINKQQNVKENREK